MPATANPYGLYVRRSGGARYHTAGCSEYPVVANLTGAMYQGAPVAFVAAGGVGPAAATPAAAAQVVGTMQGVNYRTPEGRPIWDNKLPANSYTAGARQIKVMVNDDPSLVMMVQATATLTEAAIGKVAALANVAAGNPTSGRSILALDAATVAASGDFAVRIVGIRDPGTAFPDCFVTWAPGVHSNRAATAGALTAPDAINPAEQQKIFEDFVKDQVNEARAAQGLPPLPEEGSSQQPAVRPSSAIKPAAPAPASKGKE